MKHSPKLETFWDSLQINHVLWQWLLYKLRVNLITVSVYICMIHGKLPKLCWKVHCLQIPQPPPYNATMIVLPAFLLLFCWVWKSDFGLVFPPETQKLTLGPPYLCLLCWQRNNSSSTMKNYSNSVPQKGTNHFPETKLKVIGQCSLIDSSIQLWWRNSVSKT